MPEIRVESARVPGLSKQWRVVRCQGHVRTVLKAFSDHALAVKYADNAARAAQLEPCS